MTHYTHVTLYYINVQNDNSEPVETSTAGNDDGVVCAIDFWTIASRPHSTEENNEIFTGGRGGGGGPEDSKPA
jgi:hypothetical protein